MILTDIIFMYSKYDLENIRFQNNIEMKITLENKEEDNATHPSQSKTVPAREDITVLGKNTDTADVNCLTTRSSKIC